MRACQRGVTFGVRWARCQLVCTHHRALRSTQVAEATWAETFKYLADNNVLFEGILLKPSMVTPGAEHKKKATPEEVRGTARRRYKPACRPGGTEPAQLPACRVPDLKVSRAASLRRLPPTP